ncbi:MAG: U32 family peptidase [Clostridia bacterium]|nr:U32 family peptidase [Clostridia bacterium]
MFAEELFAKKIIKAPRGSGTVKVPELLSPAGDPDCGRAAILNGADAVYAGLKEGSARASAGNFTPEELRDLCDFAHLRESKVYVALNILCFGEDELERFAENAKKAALAGADGVIIQDTGLLSRISEMRLSGQIRRDFAIHVSTQAGIVTEGGLRLAKRLGADRVILPRELTLEEIAALAASAARIGLELEVFAHGALCMCYSGSCLLSSFHGGRSGNRGQCAQPCRLRCTLSDNRAPGASVPHPLNHLSPDDLCALGLLDRLSETGVASIKIEGRLKTAEYAALTARVYRAGLDAAAEGRFEAFKEQELPEAVRILQTVFTRAGGGAGFLLGNTGMRHVTLDNAGRRGAPLGPAAELRRVPPPARTAAALPFFSFKLRSDPRLKKPSGSAYVPVPGDGVILIDGDGTVIGSGVVNRAAPVDRGTDGQAGVELLVCGELTRPAAGDNIEAYLTSDLRLSKAIAAACAVDDQNVKVPLSLAFSAAQGQCAALTVSGPSGVSVTVESEEPCAPAARQPLTEDSVAKQLSRLNDTCFYAHSISAVTEGSVFMPVAALNALRRKGVDAYTAAVLARHIVESDSGADALHTRFLNTGLSPCQIPGGLNRAVSFLDPDPLSAAYDAAAFSSALHASIPGSTLPGSVLCYLPWQLWLAPDRCATIRSIVAENGGLAVATLPVLPLGGQYIRFLELLPALIDNCDGLQLTTFNDFGLLEGCFMNGIDISARIRQKKLLICADLSLNITNLETVRVLTALGASVLTLSPEYPAGSLAQGFPAGVKAEIVKNGPVPLMRMRHCVVGYGGNNCRRCGPYGSAGRFALKDERGATYPLLTLPDDRAVAGNSSTDIFPRFCQNVLLSPGDFRPKAALLAGAPQSEFADSALPDNVIIRTQIAP